MSRPIEELRPCIVRSHAEMKLALFCCYGYGKYGGIDWDTAIVEYRDGTTEIVEFSAIEFINV